jgi:hypothetical protein
MKISVPLDVRPVIEKLPIGAKELDPIVFTVGYQDPAIFHYPDPMGQIELSWTRSRSSP